MTILSIQSQVSVGHAGNSAAVFPIQRLGLEVWPVPTALFSNHTGHPTWRGFRLERAEFESLLAGIEELGALANCRAVLVGYLGSAEQVGVVAEALERLRASGADAVFCLDPVMGERSKGLYVEAGVAEAVSERLVPLADIVIPNPFELEYLSGQPASFLEGALGAADLLRAKGPGLVVCTSCGAEEEGRIATLAVGGEGAWRVETPLLPGRVSGTGDAFAAIFLARRLLTGAVERALALAVSAVYGLIGATIAADPQARELALVAAQEEIVNPSELFDVERVR